jgi:hypothetical protein
MLLSIVQADSEAAQPVRRQMIELWQRRDRALEEQEMCVIGDMVHAYTHFYNRCVALQEAVAAEKDTGKCAILYKLGVAVERRCNEVVAAFSDSVVAFSENNIKLPLIKQYFLTPTTVTNTDGDSAEDMSDVADIIDKDLDLLGSMDDADELVVEES